MTDASPAFDPQHPRAARPWVRVASAFLLPLFFVVLFPLAFVSAIHNPTAHDIPVLIVGPAQVAAGIAAELDGGETFAATESDVTGDGRTSVRERTVEGAIEITPGTPGADGAQPTPSFTVTTYVANAAGRQIASTVQAAGAGIAEELGTTAKVVDVAPLAATDTLGTTLFYLLTYTSLAAYLVIIVLMQVVPKARLSTRFGAVAAASVAAPLLVFGLSAIFVGDYGASFGSIAALLGVNALYVFTVGSVAILVEQFLGKAATFGVMAFVVFLNFPSAGGATPASLLPEFWQAIHGVYFGSGAYESFRSIVYFDGNGAGRWLVQLLAWMVGLVLVNFVVYQTKKVRELAKDNAALLAASRDIHRTPDPNPSTPERRAITASEGANR